MRPRGAGPSTGTLGLSHGRRQTRVPGLLWGCACPSTSLGVRSIAAAVLCWPQPCELGLGLVAGAPLLCPTGAGGSV